jgi:8-oxo-dGTP diphosphatase
MWWFSLMELLAEIRDEDLGFEEREVSESKTRKAARCILKREDKIALLHVQKFSYYKLPGGGLEGDESWEEALKREVREEIGSEIEIKGKIGKIVEYKSHSGTKQVSRCYIAEEVESGSPEFTEKEVKEGFRPEWQKFEETTRKMEAQNTSTYMASFITARDRRFLREFSRKY